MTIQQTPFSSLGLAIITSSILLLLLPSNNTLYAQMIMPGSRSLTIKECLSMISTETGEEFNFDQTSPQLQQIASQLWSDANTFEWQKASEAEYWNDQKYPYLLCHVGKGMSGYQRRLELLDAIRVDRRTNDDDGNGSFSEEGGGNNLTLEYIDLQEQETTAANNTTTNETTQQQQQKQGETIYLRPLYNEEDFLCVYGQLYASVASGITGVDFITQPIVPSLKYMKGSVTGMQSEIDFHNGVGDDVGRDGNGYNPSLDIVLCPGVATANVTEMTTSNGGSTTTTTTDDVTAEIGEWEEIPEETSQDIIDMLVPKTIASKLANSISDTYYLTSDAYMNTTSEMGEELTSRSKLWKSLITDYQESGKCDETYSKRLKWTIQRSVNPEVTSSLLNVEFNTTGNTNDDVGCMLTLSLAISAHPNVCSLESKSRVDVSNRIIQWLTQSELENKVPFYDSGLNGEGQTVAISDTGCDTNSCYFIDEETGPPNDTIDRNHRKIVQYVDFVDNSDYEYGHGSHVAGTVAGKRIDGDGMADGVAPGAKIAFADIGDGNGELSLPLDSALLRTGRPDAKIHSCSWGSDLNFYTTQSRNFDQYMYDNDDFLIVVAAGNSGHGDAPNTVGSPATGKNVLTVGAHHNTASSRSRVDLGPSYIADFSSRGPTSDGRMKPDIMAPGKAVLSAGARPDEYGECDPSKNPGPGGKADGVLSLQGTSMATPVVAGTAAILRQYFEQGYYPTGVKNETNIVDNPSGALIKAVLLNGAQFLQGVDNGGNGITEIKPYDNNQGFGRMSLQDAVYLPGKTNVQLTVFDRQVVNDQTSQDYVVTIDKTDGCSYEKLAVTLVWVEPGSNPGCVSCVLNDLDLEVELNGRTYYPNGRNSPDRDNNAERVVIEGVQDGDVATITVTGYNLMQSFQRYALVATGCFGGVSNQNFVDQCSVFECDNSQSKRMATILMAIFIPLGAILCCCCVGMWRRRKQVAGGRWRRTRNS